MKILHQIADYLNQKSNTSLLVLFFILFIGVTSVRFNRNTALINRPLNDARYFIAYVEHFRGETPSDVIRPASNWRMLVPFVAAQLPLEPLTAINITNQLLLLLSLLFLFQSLSKIGIDKGYKWLALFLFVISFPTFYYTTIGYVDAGVMCFVSLGIWATLSSNWWALLLAFAIGFLAKESIIVLLPFTAAYYWILNERKKAIGLTIVLLAIYILESYLVREFAYLTPGEKNNLFWKVDLQNIQLNLSRINSLLAPVLSLGVVGLIYLWSVIQTKSTLIKNPLAVASLALLLTTFAMYGFAFITTFADGRPIWLAYYGMLLVSMQQLQQAKN